MYDIDELRDRVLLRFDVESFCDFLGIGLEDLFDSVAAGDLHGGGWNWKEKLEEELYSERDSLSETEE